MGPVQLRSQRLTVALTVDTPRQARRFLRSSRPTRYQYSLGLLSWQFRGKSRRTLLAMRGEAFLHVGAAETEEFEAKGRFEGGAEHAVPVVQAVFCPADRVLGALRQILGEAGRGREHILVVDAGGDQADALGFGAEQRLAGEQVVLGLGH